MTNWAATTIPKKITAAALIARNALGSKSTDGAINTMRITSNKTITSQMGGFDLME
jgi:hypothetical protein